MDRIPTVKAHCGDLTDSLMHKTVYYLTHRDTGLRRQYYRTLQGARIAQRSRNRDLGFLDRIERVDLGNWEVERCVIATGEVVDATWCIVEDTIEQEDLCE